jgi:predicted transcriptional regulator
MVKVAMDFLKENGLVIDLNGKEAFHPRTSVHSVINSMNAFASYLTLHNEKTWIAEHEKDTDKINDLYRQLEATEKRKRELELIRNSLKEELSEMRERAKEMGWSL